MHVMTPLSLTTAMIIAASAWAAPTAAPSVEVQQAIRAAEQLSLAFEAAATRVGPSVVKIGTAGIVPANANPWTRRRGTMMVESTGSGIIISPDGHVLTNAHVVSQADRVIVTLHDGRRFEAESVGIDHGADLAVLRIDATKLHPAELAHNTTPRIGQWVLAVGSPFGLGHSFSAGIVSATGRSNLGLSEFEHLIQTDAARLLTCTAVSSASMLPSSPFPGRVLVWALLFRQTWCTESRRRSSNTGRSSEAI
jgi:serine protease Do